METHEKVVLAVVLLQLAAFGVMEEGGVAFNGRPAHVEKCRVSAYPMNQVWPGHQRPVAETVEAEFVTVAVPGRLSVPMPEGATAEDVVVRPLSRKSGRVAGGSFEIEVPAPGQFSVEVKGRPALHVFAVARKDYPPVPNERRFGPGMHDVGVIVARSGETITIEEGAVVYGGFWTCGTTNVTLRGRGIIDASRIGRIDDDCPMAKAVQASGFRRGENHGARISTTTFCAAAATNLVVEGVTFRDAPIWAVTLRNGCRNVLLDDVKLIGMWRYNSDGIDVCASENVTVRNSFVRSFDDCIVARGAYLDGEVEPLRNFVVENCVLWCDWGKNLEVWAGYRPCLIENVVFRDIACVGVSHMAADVTTWYGSPDTRIRNITMKNVEVDFVPPLYRPQSPKESGGFLYRPLEQFRLYVCDCAFLAPFDRDHIQFAGKAKGDEVYRVGYENISFENFRVYGKAPRLAAKIDASRPGVSIRGCSFRNMPVEPEIKGNVDVGDEGGTVRVAERYGFDPADSAGFLQAALDSNAREIVLENKGTPWITSKPLRGHGNQTITFEKGAFLEAKRGAFKGVGDRLLLFENCTNVVLRGAGPEVSGLRMWRCDYADKAKYRHSEWRHGLALLSCVDVRVEGLSFNETGGDGLYVSTSDRRRDFDGRRASRNIAVKNCVFDHNHRQGVSIIGVDGLLVEDCRMTNTKGTPPEAGIDFEPNRTDQCLRNIVLRRCHIEGNEGNGIEIAHGHFGADTEPNLISVEDCTVVGNRHGFFYPTSDQDADRVSDSGSVTIRGTVFRNTRDRAVHVGKRVNCRGSVTIENCRLENCGVDRPDDLCLSISGHNLGEPDAFHLKNVTVVRPKERPLLRMFDRKGPFRGRPTLIDGEVVTETNGKEERHVFDAAWRERNCPYVDAICPPALPSVPAPLAGARVVDSRPGELLPCAPALLRGRGRHVVFYAKKGERVRFTVRVAVIGRRTFADTKPLEVYARGGSAKLAEFEPPRTPQPEDREFTAPETGFYELCVNPAWNAVAITHCSAPIALDATKRPVPLAGVEGGACAEWLATAKERLLVRVPAGRRFSCNLACSVGENVAFEMRDPAGVVVTNVATVEGVERFQAQAEETAMWSLRFGRPAFGVFEDFQVGVTGVPGWIFLTEGRYWEALTSSSAAKRNLLANADMARYDGMGEPAGWSRAVPRMVVNSKATVKPLGGGAFELVFVGKDTMTFRQNMLTLQPGGKYRLSAEVQTSGMQGGSMRFRMWSNGGSEKRFGELFPENTKGEWKAVELVTTAPPTAKRNEYYVAVVGRGEAAAKIRNLRLEALAEEADLASAPTPARFAGEHYRRIVPIDPLLDRVSAATGEMTFYWPGEPSCGKARCRLVAVVDGKTSRTAAFDAEGRASVAFGALAAGAHQVRVAVKDAAGAELDANDYRITAIGPALEGPAGRRLNNFVVELVHQPLANGDMRFFRGTEGWVWIAFEGDCGEASGTLDGGDDQVVRRREGERRLETQRFVGAGWHTLHVKGAKGGTLRIHAVKPIVGNSYGLKRRPVNLSARPTYDLDFALRFDALGSFNSLTGAESFMPDPFYGERGVRLLGHGGGANAWSTNRYTRALMYNTLANRSWRRGLDVFIDENSVDVVMVWGHNVERACSVNFSETVWRMNEERPETAVHTYFSDSNYGNFFRDRKCKTSEIACTINTGHGRGWVVPESYAPTYEKESASALWEDHFARFFQSTTNFVPAAKGRILPWMATYVGLGFWSSYTQPHADAKKHYSRLMRAFATRPEFADIAGLGFGGLGSGEDDLTRWGARILRHYCLEGRTDDLADSYGFRWNPGLVENCDFAEGLRGWTAEPAAGGAVKGERIPGYGGQQGRQNRPDGVGDGVAVFTASAAGANRLEQRLNGLETGKYYSLQFCVADYRSVREKVEKRPPVAFSAKVEGGVEVKELAYCRPSVGTWARPIRPHLSNCRIVFRAEAPTAKLVFADRAADGRALPAGTRQALNYIVLNPYYLESPDQIRDVVDWATAR